MTEDEDEWTDEESNDKLVERVNHIQLAELKDIILSVCPSFSFTAKDGYFLEENKLNSGALTHFRYMIQKRYLRTCFKRVLNSLKPILNICISKSLPMTKKRYKTSSFGWSSKEKQVEMREPATRFLILQNPDSETVIGFLSWQVDTEDDEAVIYWYTPLTQVLIQVTNCNYSLHSNGVG